MDWLDTVFSYGERGNDAGLLAEPVNVVTNASFFIAAALAWYRYARQPASARDIDSLLLIALVVLIGVGSTVFHLTAKRWALVADVAPITLFIVAYLNFALIRFLGLTPVASLLLTLAFFATAPLMAILPGVMTLFNGSIGFAPTLLVLVAMGIILMRRGHPAGAWLTTSAGVFAVSLVFRTIDKTVCDYTAIADHVTGTHALWHILNAVVLYLVLRAAIDHGHHGEQRYEVIAPTGPRT